MVLDCKQIVSCFRVQLSKIVQGTSHTNVEVTEKLPPEFQCLLVVRFRTHKIFLQPHYLTQTVVTVRDGDMLLSVQLNTAGKRLLQQRPTL